MSGADVTVVRGEPAAEELAALLVVCARLAAAAGRPADHRGTVRRPPAMTAPAVPGAGGWRRSAWPA